MRAKYVFGLTPWGRFFIDAMEALADDGRLARGRSYAGNGSVFELSVKDGLVKAKVEGNYAPFYRISIRFKPLSDTAIAAVRAVFDADPLLYARVASGEQPEGLVAKLGRAGASLVPKRWSEIERSCSCPDDGDPCKHQAAVYYLVAQEIDRDPFTLFRLRGVDIKPIASKAKASVAATAASATEASVVAIAAVPDPLIPRLVKPWSDPEGVYADPLAGLGALSHYAAAIPGMLPPSRGLAPFDLRIACAAFYHEAAGRIPEMLEPFAQVAMDGAAARAFAAGRFSILVRPDGTASIEGPSRGRLRLVDASRLFAACDERGGSASYRFLSAFFRAARSIASACAFVPDIRVTGESFSVLWKPARFGSDVDALLAALEPAATAPDYDGKGRVPDGRSTIELLAIAFLTELVEAIGFTLPSSREAGHPIARALFRGTEESCSAPGERALPGALDAWLSVFDMAATRPPLELKVAEAKGERYRLSASLIREGQDGGERVRIPLRKAAADGGERAGEALSFAALLSNFVPALGKLGVELAVTLDEKQLADFVIDAAPLLGRFGVSLVLPKDLRRLATPRPALRAIKKASLTTYLDMATAFAFDWTVAIGDERLSPAEFSILVDSGLRLVRWRNEWVRIDPAEAAIVLARVSGRKALDALEALRESLSGELEADGELQEAVDFMVGAGRRASDDAPVPSSLAATLRPYQERGYRWMLGNFERGLGCLLADDMGLGKTVQTIAAILSLKESGKLEGGALVCAPASLLTNWERELTRFAPSLSLCLYYGTGRKRKPADVTLSSYETWIRDQKKGVATKPRAKDYNKKAVAEPLATVVGASGTEAGSAFEGPAWSLVVLDEAHYIKNPESNRAKAVKAIKAERKLALTGTPVENNLAELWSVFDFALPGYLGTLARFSNQYRKPIELDRSEKAADSLRRATAPFIMRRLKTDAAIAADLPDKLVVDEYAVLTPEQAALYEAIASDGMGRIASSGSESRLGLVLALITALKQASNHPRNFDKESDGSSARSGKARLLVALLESAFEAGERVLVFSQYVEMLAILGGIVRTELGVEPYILHGGMTKKKRDEQVDRFQRESGPGVFLVSLKAGGVGLNLTAASRVVHYDLWFNPAVENQATDRAFRIGQSKNVFVHRMITRDTIEERIDAMIAAKRDLSDLTVRAGESWIADMGDEELRALVSLR